MSLTIDEGEVVGIVGPTACGKTTLLNILASLDLPSSGNVVVKPPKAIGYMMQETALLPWRTLGENALLGTEVVFGKGKKQNSKADNYFQAFELLQHRNNYPETSSAGMKQRVALIRTLLINPSTILLDEPFSNLDFDIKLKIQRHLLKYQAEHKATMLIVTHDIEDAIALCNRVIVLSDKPTRVKREFLVDLGLAKRDPVESRKAPRFRNYFAEIWEELKYLEDESQP
jgi:NitT/TauT family transport system ATP-binding protein